mmetsp:Transcript_59036/g.133499  ORF Transcript_59036/g.133499 Transcript_59036/m.133499 type:complete len:214 (-) Transcript_59036:38-679(-)
MVLCGEKKQELRQYQDDNKQLSNKLAAADVRQGSRKQVTDTLSDGISRLQDPMGNRQVVELGNEVTQLEGKIAALNSANVEMSAAHKKDRKQLEQQADVLKGMRAREGELAKRLEKLVRALNEAQRNAEGTFGDNFTDYRVVKGASAAKVLGMVVAPQMIVPGAVGSEAEVVPEPPAARSANGSRPQRKPSRRKTHESETSQHHIADDVDQSN